MKFYEWILYSKQNIIRQGILCAESKKMAQQFLIKSLNDDEKNILKSGILSVKQLKI